MKHPRSLLLGVCLISLLSTVGMAMPYPILAPIFVRGSADVFTHFMGVHPKLLMGVALAVNPLGILIGSLFIGPYSDRHGRRHTLLWTLFLTMLSTLLSAWALHERWYLVFVLSRFLTGLTEGNTAVARAVLADLHPQLDRTRSFAWLNASSYGGWLLGPLFGGLTLAWGEPVPFVLAGLAAVPCLLLIWRVWPADEGQVLPSAEAAPTASVWRQAWQQQALGLLRVDPLLARVFGLQLAYTVGLTCCYEFAPLWMLENAGLDAAGIAWVTAGQCAVMSAASVALGRFGLLSGRGHPLRGAAACALGAALGLALLSLVPGRTGLFLIMAMGLPLALYNALLPSWVSERFAQYGQGRVMGLLSVTFMLANVITAVLGSGLSLLDSRWIMAAGGVCCAWAAWLLLQLAREQSAVATSAATQVS